MDPCAKQETEDLGALGFFFTSLGYVLFPDSFILLFIHQLTVVIHFQVLVCMKALQHRCVAEGVISRLRKRNETLTNKQDQYKEALRTLNKEVTELNEKLKEEIRQREKE